MTGNTRTPTQEFRLWVTEQIEAIQADRENHKAMKATAEEKLRGLAFYETFFAIKERQLKKLLGQIAEE